MSRVPALSSTVCISGIGTAVLTAATDGALAGDLPQLAGRLGATAEAAEIVESDRRVRPVEVDVGGRR